MELLKSSHEIDIGYFKYRKDYHITDEKEQRKLNLYLYQKLSIFYI